MKLILSASFCLSFFAGGAQTTVIAKIINKNTIVIAADSRAPIVNYDPSTKTSDTILVNHRKAYKSGKFAFATIGNLVSEQARIADSVVNLNMPLDSTVYYYAVAFYNRMNRYISFILNDDIARLNSFIKSCPWYISQTVFCGFMKDTPTIFLTQLNFKTNAENKYYLDVDTIRWRKDTAMVFGFMDNIYDKAIAGKTWKGNYLKTIKNLIKIEANANPKFVAEPIDIILLNPNKIIMIPKKQNYDIRLPVKKKTGRQNN